MQRLLGALFLMIFIGPIQSWAFEYQIVEKSLMKMSILETQEIQSHFQRLGFRSLSTLSLLGPKTPFDLAFVSTDFRKTILIKSGLRAPESERGKIIEIPSRGLSAFHFELNQTPYLLVALNISSVELLPALKPWISKTTSSQGSARSKWSLLLPAAQASVCDPQNSSLLDMNKTAQHIESTELMQNIGKCGAQALSGLQGSVQDTLSFFKKLATNPRELWSEMKESFVELKNFALNIHNEIGPLIQQLTQLSSEEKMQIACTMAGQVVATAAQALVSGAALTRMMPSLILKLRQTAGLLSKLSNLDRQNIRLPKALNLSEEVIRCGL